jgi:cell division septation protein DedD
MEHFEQNITPVKEKNVYTLHLDTTRILILASVAIGIIALSYIVGSYSFKEKETRPKLVKSNTMYPSDSMSIPSAPHSGELSALFENKSNNIKPFEENSKLDEIPAINDKPIETLIPEDTKIIEPIVPKKAVSTKSTTPKSTIAKSTTNNSKSVSKNITKSEPKIEKASAKIEKIAVEKTAKNKNIVEVSAPVMKKQGGFAIQMASFDTESKAKKMSNSLKAEDYDSYVEHVRINGKDAYRVKIGPIGDKKEAISMLNELQENDRYADCYITKE